MAACPCAKGGVTLCLIGDGLGRVAQSAGGRTRAGSGLGQGGFCAFFPHGQKRAVKLRHILEMPIEGPLGGAHPACEGFCLESVGALVVQSGQPGVQPVVVMEAFSCGCHAFGIRVTWPAGKRRGDAARAALPFIPKKAVPVVTKVSTICRIPFREAA